MKTWSYAILILLVSTAPAFAAVNISSPSNGETVSSPFTLSASATECSSQSISTMSYSLDSGSDLNTVASTSMDVKISAGTGAHTVHVKSWGDKGALCVADVDVTVTSGASSDSSDSSSDSSESSPSIPSDAVKVGNLQTIGHWTLAHDPGNGGSSSGKMSLVGSPSHSGATRKTVTDYKGAGGERFWVSFGDNTSSTNFLYDGWIYLNSTADKLANLEMDMNSVLPNGDTVIYGFECDGYNGTWDYTMNKGTPKKPVDAWIHSHASCNPRKWSRDAWHHVQIEYSRNGSGAVTYKAVWLDGKKQTIGATVPSAFRLGWAPTLLTNLQVDGIGSSGSVTVYLDDLTISRW